MAIVGSNLESKEIGLSIGLSGTYYNTEIDAVTGYLKLKTIDVDAQGEPVYAEEGHWISDVINLGDKFADFDKVFTTAKQNGASSLAIQTRVSDNGYDWSDWIAVAMDGTIQSDTKQYVQVKINLYAGFVNDVFIIDKSEYVENNIYIEEKFLSLGNYLTPTTTSNVPTIDGFPFSDTRYSTGFDAYHAFDKSNSTYFSAVTGSKKGIIGYYFNNKKRVTKYKITSSSVASTVNYLPKKWVLQGSSNTTNGLDGDWFDLDAQENQIWTKVSETKEYEFKNARFFNAYRINYSENNGNANYSGLGELDFFDYDKTGLVLKRKYEYDMTLDTTWSEDGSLHRQKVTRDEWLRIDKMNVLRK